MQNCCLVEQQRCLCVARGIGFVGGVWNQVILSRSSSQVGKTSSFMHLWKLQILIEVDLEHLSQEVTSEVELLIDNYKPERNLTSPVEMKILLTDELPVFQHPRR